MESIMKHKQHKNNLAATQTQSHPNCQIGKDVEKMRSFMQEDGNKHNKTIGDEGITVDFRFIKVHTSN